MNEELKKPVSLEDLLHLKRSERPPEQFWVQFENDLRAKQLAAIVQHGPWWSSWRRMFRALTRQSLPIGASAVLALGLLSFHQSRSHSARPAALLPLAPAASADLAETASDDPAFAAATLPKPAALAVTLTAAPAIASAAGAKAQPAVASVAASVSPGNDPFSTLVGSPQRSTAVTPIQSDAWSHFGDQQLAANSVASTVGFVPRAFAVAEPLAQMANPLDERRAALLNGSLPRSDNGAVDSVMTGADDHSASRLSDERLYESVRRYGLGGNRISVRF